MKILIVAALAAVVGQAQPPGETQWQSARAALDRHLNDYPTARFRDVRGNGNIVCGFVNAKNRLGAFTGWRRFAVTWVTTEVTVLTESSDAQLLDLACGSDGAKYGGPDYSDRLMAR